MLVDRERVIIFKHYPRSLKKKRSALYNNVERQSTVFELVLMKTIITMISNIIKLEIKFFINLRQRTASLKI